MGIKKNVRSEFLSRHIERNRHEPGRRGSGFGGGGLGMWLGAGLGVGLGGAVIHGVTAARFRRARD
jgi:hypothetical protein